MLPITRSNNTTETPYLWASTEDKSKYFKHKSVTWASRNGPKNAVILPEKAKNQKIHFLFL